MSAVQLLGSSFDQGLRAPHYVNGRLLAAEDLKADRDATLARLAWLGRAAGPGVIDGLLVSTAPSSATSLQVTAGLGLNRNGDPIRLASPVTLPLASIAPGAAPQDDAGRFARCDFSAGNSSTSIPSGAYLLTALPASQLDGLAPLQASAGSTSPASCTGKWEVEGLQFKAIPLVGFPTSGVTGDNRRNLLAHWCFGSEALRKLAVDPFSFDDRYGGLDQLGSDLTGCDLPLAVFFWTGSALDFVDGWSARRRLTRPSALDAWSGLLSDKRVAEAQARFLQFQQQAGELVESGRAAKAVGSLVFPFLPPAGLLPITTSALFARVRQAGSGERQIAILLAKKRSLSKGFDLEVFFEGFPDRIGVLDHDSVDFLVNQSWHDEAIRLERDKPNASLVNLYLVKENLLDHHAQPYVLFTKRFSATEWISLELR